MKNTAFADNVQIYIDLLHSGFDLARPCTTACDAKRFEYSAKYVYMSHRSIP